MKAIEVEHVSFSYGRNKAPVLKDTSFSVDEGDFLAVIGPNGGGKSTLMKLILGLLHPVKGQIRIFGKKTPSRLVNIGYVPQNTNHNIDFPITVEECVASGRIGLEKKAEAVKLALEQMDVVKYADRKVGELSGGERQRVLFARALVVSPRILFLDEPSSNVDAAGQKDIYELLTELNHSMTIVVVSHDLMAISSHIKSVLCVNRTVYHHPGATITNEMLNGMYNCPVDLIAHGLPHRVLASHDHFSAKS